MIALHSLKKAFGVADIAFDESEILPREEMLKIIH
jgi:hypothetical protein